MPRRLKVYQTSLGFYDQAIAAPSMKAALEAWGADSNLFHQGVAKETDDPKVVAATMAKPGVVLRRPVGSNGPFKEHAELPTDLAADEAGAGRRSKLKKQAPPKLSDKKTLQAAREFEREQKRRDAERRKEEAARAKERERREKVVAKAQAALDNARREHEEKADAIEVERAALDERAQAEETRWEKQKAKLEAALRRTRD